MAGDYLPIRLDLADDPAVIQIAAALELDELDVVGRLVATWSWFNRHTTDGHAPGVTAAWLNRYTHTNEWAEAMAASGWLEITDAGLTVPDYDSWNSEAAKIRLKANERKRKQRAREKAEKDADAYPSRQQPQDGHAKRVTDTRPHDTTEQHTTGQDKETDCISTSWKKKDYQLQVRQTAAEHFRGEPFLADASQYREEDRRDLLAIAAIHHSGQVRPAWFLTTLDHVKQANKSDPITAPVRYLKRALAERWPKEAEKRFGGFYKALFRLAQGIPPELVTPKAGKAPA